jgi:hypothetical protein
MMVNYKIVNTRNVINLGGGFAEVGASIIETKTGQTIKHNIGLSKAKTLVRHLNFGGGFDGFTPAFFLAENAKFLENVEELV